MASPTPKQIRHHYARCRYRFYMLLTALHEAHDVGVINYEERWNPETKKYFNTLSSVCDAVYTAKDNFESSTKNQLAKAMSEEIMSKLKGAW